MGVFWVFYMKNFDVFISPRCCKLESKAKKIGYACLVGFMCKEYSLCQIITLGIWVVPAIDHDQIVFFFDKSSTPLGYVSWAYLASDSEERLLNDPEFLLHFSEWNEGGDVWIIDFYFPRGGAKEAVVWLKKMFRKDGIDKVGWVRRNAGSAVKKVFRCRL